MVSCDRASLGRFLGSMAWHLPAIVRTRSTEPVAAAMTGTTCHFDVLGHRIEVAGEFFQGARELYCRRVYFSQPGFELRRDDVVVDLGANAGLFTTLAAMSCARVLAVQAQSGFLALIRSHLRRNGCEQRATVVHALVGAETGTLASAEQRSAASHHQHEPEVIGMQALLDRGGISRIDFLKMDIEGSEFSLLRENHQWLQQVRRIAMEVHPQFGPPDELVS